MGQHECKRTCALIACGEDRKEREWQGKESGQRSVHDPTHSCAHICITKQAPDRDKYTLGMTLRNSYYIYSPAKEQCSNISQQDKTIASSATECCISESAVCFAKAYQVRPSPWRLSAAAKLLLALWILCIGNTACAEVIAPLRAPSVVFFFTTDITIFFVLQSQIASYIGVYTKNSIFAHSWYINFFKK